MLERVDRDTSNPNIIPVPNINAYANFDPKQYLGEYYAEVSPENRRLIETLHHMWKKINHERGGGRVPTLIELSGGPTVYQLAPAVPFIEKIHFADYLECNLDEVKSWQRGDNSAHNWRPFIQQSIQVERKKQIANDAPEVTQREQEIKDKLVEYFHCDGFSARPLTTMTGKPLAKKYEAVSTHFAAESITNNFDDFVRVLSNYVSVLERPGHLVMSCLERAEYYKIQGQRFEATPITREVLYAVLGSLGCDPKRVEVKSIQADHSRPYYVGYEGYHGIMVARAFFEKKRSFHPSVTLPHSA